MKVGNRVCTEDGSLGTVAYIGYPPFTEGEAVGIELDEFHINAHDGTHDGTRYFMCAPGRGRWCRREELTVVDEESVCTIAFNE